jgi:capsular polysaccharide transport system permease protein
MSPVVQGLRIQSRVIGALMMRELLTRYGRHNIGFLWMIVEPLLFAVLVGVMWEFMWGATKHGIGVMSFVISGYIPLVLFRQSVNRAAGLFQANLGLMYHRQITILDFVFVRFLIELIGAMIAYVFIAIVLIGLDLFPIPYDMGFLLLGFVYQAFFALAMCCVLAPLSEMSEVVEKFLPVTTYLMIPFSGTFTLAEWLTPMARDATLLFPPVHAMEMMRYGLYGHSITPYFSYSYPLMVNTVLLALGLLLCRRVRRSLVVE